MDVNHAHCNPLWDMFDKVTFQGEELFFEEVFHATSTKAIVFCLNLSF
jgi:hypothetical protein